jgi:hypothetical protein
MQTNDTKRWRKPLFYDIVVAIDASITPEQYNEIMVCNACDTILWTQNKRVLHKLYVLLLFLVTGKQALYMAFLVNNFSMANSQKKKINKTKFIQHYGWAIYNLISFEWFQIYFKISLSIWYVMNTIDWLCVLMIIKDTLIIFGSWMYTGDSVEMLSNPKNHRPGRTMINPWSIQRATTLPTYAIHVCLSPQKN